MAISKISSDGLATSGVAQTNLAAGVAGNGPAFSAGFVTVSNTVAASTGVATKITFSSADFDTASAFSSSRFTPLVAGYYQISAVAGSPDAWSASSFSATRIFKNGNAYASNIYSPTTNFNIGTVSALIYLNGSTDYIELYVQQNSGSTRNMSGSISGCLVRAA